MTRRVPRARVRTSEVEHLVRMPVDLARGDHDVFLSPGTLPPLVSRRPWVQTIHDLAPLVLDRNYGWDRTRWRLVGRRVRAADAIVAVSRFAADEAVRVLGLEAGRVEVVRHGLDPAFHPDGPTDPALPAEPTIATVVRDDPRKGLRETLALARGLCASGRMHRLHVAGDVAASSARALTSVPTVRVRGYVPDLPAFLRGADVVVVTSRYEGFGFVPLEAMGCGTPVVAFDNSAVSEIAGDAAALVPDGDVRAMREVVGRLLDDDHARTRLARAGRQRAREFTWAAAAERYAAILGGVIH